MSRSILYIGPQKGRGWFLNFLRGSYKFIVQRTTSCCKCETYVSAFFVSITNQSYVEYLNPMLNVELHAAGVLEIPSSVGLANGQLRSHKNFLEFNHLKNSKTFCDRFWGLKRSVLYTYCMPTKLQSISWPSPFKCGRQSSIFQYSLLNKKKSSKSCV
jgi:hypothetical protein